MTVSEKIRVEVKGLEEGTIFRYEQLPITPNEVGAAAKAMERLVTKGCVGRLSKGLFYKPKVTPFGPLKPNEKELLNSIFFKKGKRVAYETGTSFYNNLGLTTQVPATIKIASFNINTPVPNFVKVNFVKSYVKVTDDNYYLLGLLDSLKDFNRIPDMNYKNGIRILSKRLRALSNKQTKEIVRYALAYPPRVRALLGALLEGINEEDQNFSGADEELELGEELRRLKKSLTPFSSYSFGLTEEQLPTIKNWKIR